ncbi:MAG: hypothetical protein LC746_00150 [Acidobacteria bacterium]|nr:hypothetical protein [Acidobacteriota bacterium]
MRETLRIMLCVCAVAAASRADASASVRGDEPDVAVVKFGWSRRTLPPEGGAQRAPIPMEGEVETTPPPSAVVSRRMPQSQPPPLPTADADSTEPAERGRQSRAREGYEYRARVRNTGANVVTLVGWDYVFLDHEGRREIARHHFETRARIKPGAERQLKVFTTEPPTRLLDASAPDRAPVERVVVTRVEYEGDRVWRRR